MAIAVIPYRVSIHHDGREYVVEIPALQVPQCTNCLTISLDSEANEAIDLAFRQEAKLLIPAEILKGREKLGLTQEAFAEWFGIAKSTICRWETGVQVQQRVMDSHLRAFFTVPQFRAKLRELHGIKDIPFPEVVVYYAGDTVSVAGASARPIVVTVDNSPLPLDAPTALDTAYWPFSQLENAVS